MGFESNYTYLFSVSSRQWASVKQRVILTRGLPCAGSSSKGFWEVFAFRIWVLHASLDSTMIGGIHYCGFRINVYHSILGELKYNIPGRRRTCAEVQKSGVGSGN
jgi:hypothetical protein